jgi:hypothetical protein
MIKSLLVLGILFLPFASFAARAQADPPPGNIKLLPGYQHQTLQGIDTRVGKIWKPGGIEIKYDIGHLAGDYANPKNRDEYQWYREQVVGGHTVHCALDKGNTLVVSFPDTESNFMATVKSQADVADMLLMVLTYQPPTRRR